MKNYLVVLKETKRYKKTRIKRGSYLCTAELNNRTVSPVVLIERDVCSPVNKRIRITETTYTGIEVSITLAI